MKQFHGMKKKHSFFEGWYLKHRIGTFTISLIPAFHVDNQGQASVSIQIITPSYTGSVFFPAEQFLIQPDRFSLQIGKNHFSDTGIAVDLVTEDFYVRGALSYGPLTPPQTDLMGPFQYLPFMQCNHGVLSLSHTLCGVLDVNGTPINFSSGSGYIEKDWGSSFPQSYLWTHGDWLAPSGSPCSVMLSIAHIPIGAAHFTGCIASVYCENREYRLATYRRVSILEYTSKRVVLKQGNLRLSITCLQTDAHPLAAPVSGTMSRTILESVSGSVRYHFTENGTTLFDTTVPFASFEIGDVPSESEK
ncbi:MAG: tocopherol cyclase family protein [Hungatella sp.]